MMIQGPRHKTVAECFADHQGRLIDKWEHYLPIYERHFAKYVGMPVNVLEIGVSHGGSLQLWKEYFGPKAQIHGIDIDTRCFLYKEDRITVTCIDQSDFNLVEALGRVAGPFDIVIDDGSHYISHQEVSFKALWPHTRGIYLVEDIHGALPQLEGTDGLLTQYPWVMVVERPKRLIRGTPSRELRQDEIDAINLYSDL